MQVDGSVWERAESDRTKKANELVVALVGIVTRERDIVVASDSKSLLWRDLSNTKSEHEKCRRCEESRVTVESVHKQ